MTRPGSASTMASTFSSCCRVRTKNQTCSTGTTSSNCETAARATVVTVSPVESEIRCTWSRKAACP